MISLVLPPIPQLTLFGLALSAAVSNVRIAVVDERKTPESHELVATLSQSTCFRLGGYPFSLDRLGDAIEEEVNVFAEAESNRDDRGADRFSI